MRTWLGIVLIVVIVVVTLVLPAAPVEDGLFRQIKQLRSDSLTLLGLPIVITRPARPLVATPQTTPEAENSSQDMVIWMLEQADIVRVATAVRIPTATQTATVVPPTPRATQTVAVQRTRAKATATTVTVATTTLSATTIVQHVATPVDTPTPVVEAVVATATATIPVVVSTPVRELLPQSILDGFRTKMPPVGYWYTQQDGIRISVSSFKYVSDIYSRVPYDERNRYVTLTIEIQNNREPGGNPIYIDRTYLQMVDIDGRTWQNDFTSDDLSQHLLASTIMPGQRAAGQTAFQIWRFGAPAQILVTYADGDALQYRNTATIELRVWPIVQ